LFVADEELLIYFIQEMKRAAVLHLLGLEFQSEETEFIQNVDQLDVALRNHREEMNKRVDLGDLLQKHTVRHSKST